MREYPPPPKIRYIQQLFTKESPLKSEIASNLRKSNQAINISPEDAKLLQLILKLHGTISMVEIGTLHGYSTLWFAEILPENGKIYSFERDHECAEIARKYLAKSEHGHKVEIITGIALEKLPTIANQGPFDAVFIDADKAAYPKYLDWAEENTRKGGLIIGDNSLLFGALYNPELAKSHKKSKIDAMNEFNKRLADNSKYLSILIPTEEGVTIAVKLP